MLDTLAIVPLNRENLGDANQANEAFEIIGLLKPSLSQGQWGWSEELFDRTRWKRYPDYDEEFYNQHIDNPQQERLPGLLRRQMYRYAGAAGRLERVCLY